MAKKIWVLTLNDTSNISPTLQDFNGREVKNPEPYHIYAADDNHPQIADDGSKPLFYKVDSNGSIDMDAVNKLVVGGGTTPPQVPNNTGFVSAETLHDHSLTVKLSDANAYESDKAKWDVKVNGSSVPVIGVEGHNTDTFTIATMAQFKHGDTITVSHPVAGEGIKAFSDKPVTNNRKERDGFVSAATNTVGDIINITTDAMGDGITSPLAKADFIVKDGANVATIVEVTSSAPGHVTIKLNPAVTKGNTIKVSHTTFGNGLESFTDKTVVNNVQ